MIANCRNVVLVCAALGLCCVSCDPGKPADAKVNFHAASSASGNAASDTPDIPKDAQYTIFCRAFTEDTHVQDSREAQQILFNSTNMKKWYVVHSADHSTLYYGFYRCMDPRDPVDADEGKRAISDQNTIRAMQDSQGNRLFSEALIVGIDAPDPQANPAWDITRTKGTWSIEIASYTHDVNRKQAAVDTVREMRRHGIEAYYYHGPTSSSVCIGCWPAEAAQLIDAGQQNTDPDTPLVVTAKPLDPSIADPLKKMGIKPVAPQVNILDPTIIATLSKYPEHAVNGETRVLIDPVTNQRTVVDRPFLFMIPHKDPLDSAGGTATDTGPALPAPSRPSEQPGMGHLRSLDE